MKQSLGIALVTLLVAGLAAVQAQQQAPALKLEKVKDNLYVISESGGNVEGCVSGETVVRHGVKIIGAKNMAGTLAADAS